MGKGEAMLFSHIERQSWCDCYHRRTDGPYPNVFIDSDGQWFHYCETCGHYSNYRWSSVYPMELVLPYKEFSAIITGMVPCDCKGALVNAGTTFTQGTTLHGGNRRG
jgi:hypothetical protein